MKQGNEGRQAKIAHVLHLDGAGGGPRTVSSHVSYYYNIFDVTVFHGGKGYLYDTCRALGVKTVMLPLDKISTCLVGGLMLWLHLWRLQPDILIVHGQWAGPLGAIVGRLAGVRKIIYICHWPAFYTDWDLFRVVRNYFCEAVPCRLVDRVITVSESNRYQYLLRGYVPKDTNLLSIPNPVAFELVPSSKAAAAVREEFGWDADHCHVVSVGRLTDQKRMDWLLKAWVSVQRECPEARLWIVGDGEDEVNLKKMAIQLGLENTCRFLGDQRIGWNFVAASDLMVMTSLYEARGNVVTEAMACGKAIVANDVDGICDSMSDGVEGFLVPPANPKMLAERLIALISDPELRRTMGERGRISVEKFAKPKILKQYLYVIQELLDEAESRNG